MVCPDLPSAALTEGVATGAREAGWACHLVVRAFMDMFGMSPESKREALVDLGVSSFQVIAFLAKLHGDFQFPLERLLQRAVFPLTFAQLMDSFDEGKGSPPSRAGA